ncbi:MAG: MFS transporter, partial [Zetaproteobacteria bacterium]|nr:MFS transporter [Zetaproteobacteria bacterium]
FSDHQIGGLYCLVTVGCAVCIPIVGSWIDKVNLRNYAGGVLIVLCGAVMTLSFLPPLWLFLPAFFLTRFCGQGLFSHIASTATARYFVTRRGRALSIVVMGLPLAESLVPLLFIAISQIYSWQTALRALVGLTLGGLAAAHLYAPAHTHRFFQPAQDTVHNPQTSLGYRELLRTRLFWTLSIQFWVPAMLITGLYFHKISVGEAKHWSQMLLASALTAAAIGRIGATLIMGQLIDRFSACQCIKFMLLPMHGAILCLLLAEGDWSAYLYMTLTGVAAGVAGTLYSALWAEVYGTQNLGQIKSVHQQFVILSTAFAPPILGSLFDHQVTLSTQLIGMLCFSLSIHTLVMTSRTRSHLNNIRQAEPKGA